MRNDTGAAGRSDGDAYWARTSSVGLSDRFDAIKRGRNTSSLLMPALLFSALVDSFGFAPAIRHHFTSGTPLATPAGTNQSSTATPAWPASRSPNVRPAPR